MLYQVLRKQGEQKGVRHALYFKIANVLKIDWWIYSNKMQEKKEIGKSTDQKRCKKKTNNQSMNVTWTLIQTIKKSMTQLKEVEYDLFLNDIKKLL